MEFLQTGLLKLLPTTLTVLLMCYFICKSLDFATGILKTWKNQGTYKSRIMRDGIIRWVAELIAIVFVITIDVVLGLNFMIITATLGLFIYKECGSIKENLKECGVTLPGILDTNVDKLNPEKDKKEDKQ